MEYVICFRCWDTVEYKGKGRPPKFCSECYKIVKKYISRSWMRRHRELGNSELWEHPHKDFGREWDAIQREKRRLGLF